MSRIKNWDKFEGSFGYSGCDLSGFANSVMYLHRVVEANAYVTYNTREDKNGNEYRKYTAVVNVPDSDAKNKQTYTRSYEDLSGRDKGDGFDYIRDKMRDNPLDHIQELVIEEMAMVTGYSESKVMEYFRGNATMQGIPFRYYQNIEGQWDGVKLSSPGVCQLVEVSFFKVPAGTNNPVEEGDVDQETWILGSMVGNSRENRMDWEFFTSREVFREHLENTLTLFQ